MTRTVAILAGGLGTRVRSLTGGTKPKAMLEVAGRPFIDHKLDEVHRLGADRAVLLLGHGAPEVIDHVNRREADVAVEVVLDGEELLGTGGALQRALGSLGERFWVTYGDTLLDADLADAEALAARMGCDGCMTVLHNRDALQPSNTSVSVGKVVAYDKRPAPGTHEYIDYGYLLLPAAAFTLGDEGPFDLETVLQPMIVSGRLAAFEVSEGFHDIGTPEALAETDGWLRSRSSS